MVHRARAQSGLAGDAQVNKLEQWERDIQTVTGAALDALAGIVRPAGMTDAELRTQLTAVVRMQNPEYAMRIGNL